MLLIAAFSLIRGDFNWAITFQLFAIWSLLVANTDWDKE